ncbi:hydroxymethylbilane synthase [Roseiterribacter gracilis]|uniref:Porphobilinogen deaminase n=1 Tax=Roseiterribacter gracilis TaxID=2812848 RepID=A0A8S8XJ59_9PROT|nr:porphobilinogen deaminase [Rhodospirillales bacterium TMPK1]
MVLDRPLRIGTRGSPLALAQARETAARLVAAHPGLPAPELVPIKTTGDRIQDRTLAEAGGKGLFTKELDEALLDNRVDLAVHSMKDVPTRLCDGTELFALLPREDPRDAWFARDKVSTLLTLPAGSVVGTASLRRQALVLHARPDLRVVPLRGNVQTRLAKLDAGDVDATLLAVAGLNRLGHAELIQHALDPTELLPAVAQGAVGCVARAGDETVAALLAALDCAATRQRVEAERALLTVLDGSCRTPIAALAMLVDGRLILDGLVASPDGARVFQTRKEGPAAHAAAIGEEAGFALKAQMPADLFLA